jgi:hypothetical protein
VTEPEASIKTIWDQPCYRFFHWPPSPVEFDMTQMHDAYKFLYKVLKEKGPFDGVMGFSMGSVTSLAFMLNHAQRNPQEPADALFRYAILFSMPNLPDEDADGSPVAWGKLQIPSLHIAGSADTEWFEKSKLTFKENCRPGSATMIIHDGGHAIPKEKPMVDKIIKAIGELIETADI